MATSAAGVEENAMLHESSAAIKATDCSSSIMAGVSRALRILMQHLIAKNALNML